MILRRSIPLRSSVLVIKFLRCKINPGKQEKSCFGVSTQIQECINFDTLAA